MLRGRSCRGGVEQVIRRNRPPNAPESPPSAFASCSRARNTAYIVGKTCSKSSPMRNCFQVRQWENLAPPLGSPHPRHEVVCTQIRVAPQHFQFSVTADRRDLHDLQPLLKKPAHGLVA